MRPRLVPTRLVDRLSPTLKRRAETFGSALIPFAKAAGWRRPTLPDATLGRLGDLEVRLAVSAAEIRRAQAIRYRVFYEEMSATADLRMRSTRRDSDRFDRICDHLIVIDHVRQARAGLIRLPQIVGTYRVLGQHAADAAGGFYSAGEFDIAPLLRRKPALSFLELGRSCVLPNYRDKRTLELLWHGVWSYVRANRHDVMIGCASLEGVDPDRLALPLSFLHQHARAPAEWRAAARADRRVEMNRLRPEEIDAKAALRALPPLLKGYLRLGAMIGDGAVIDPQFGTTDVFVVLPVAAIAARYVAHYGAEAERFGVKPAGARPPRVAA